MRVIRVTGTGMIAAVLLTAAAWSQTLLAVDDSFTAFEGRTLIVEDPGVLVNDTLDGGELPPTATAERVTSPSFGFIDCEPDPGVLELCANGSFDYTPNPGFVGTDSFTYRVVDGSNTSNVATVTLTVTGCEPVLVVGPPAIDGFRCWVEASYLAKLTELGYASFQESFESDAVWGTAREPVTQPLVTSQDVGWAPNNLVSGVTTGTGAARTGEWGFFELPHGDPTGAVTDPLRDGFMGTWTGADSLLGVGGWLTSNTGNARTRFVLDGVEVGFADPRLATLYLFFGIIDTTGFTDFEIYETEGVVGDAEFIFADDFTLAVAVGCVVDADCDDALFCNGAETCAAGVCQAGTAPDCSDGVGCTTDSCNEGTDSCNHAPNDSLCDNGLFCDGAETCDAVTDCQPGTPPNCSDGVGCTTDSCNEGTDSCNHTPNNALCDNGLFCDGAETCDAVTDCQAGTPPDCNDGVGCTTDSCNEGTDSCNHAPNDAVCDNGLFCDGTETCDAVTDCQPGGDPCPGQACDEAGDVCVDCVVDADCDDALFCNGAETCAAGVCQAGSDPCPVGQVCNEVDDICEPEINHPPVAVDDAYATDEDIELNVAAPGVLDNDSDPDGDPITAIKVTDPTDGALTLNADGSFTYAPDTGFFGSDSFTYKANDTLLDSNIVTVTITVNEVDTTPPQVALLNSVAATNDGALLEGETVQVSITQILVTFDEPVSDPPGDSDPDDATNPSNYLLVRDGPNGILQTVVCGAAMGDDELISVDAVDYHHGSRTAALYLNGGVPLQSDGYRLLVCGSTSIVDLAGNPLDGDGDGTGGDDFMLAFQAGHTNYLLNPNLDRDLSGWSESSPSANEIDHHTADIDGARTSGSARIRNFTGTDELFSLSQCVHLGGSSGYDLGGMVRISSTTPGHPAAAGHVDFFASGDCSGAPLAGASTSAVQGDTALSWQAFKSRLEAPSGASSALVTFTVDAGQSPDFEAAFDRLYFVGLEFIFSDGFESGDTSVWSRSVP